jgi:hypothetical protein
MGIADPVQLITALSARVAASRNTASQTRDATAASAAESSADFIHRVNRSTRAAMQRAASPLPQDVKLPQWPDTVRGVPNVVLRSALFGATRRHGGQRVILREELIASVRGVEIRYTGERLDQNDFDVWQALLHLARANNLGAEFEVSAYQILQQLNKGDTGGATGSRATLNHRIVRLRAALLSVRSDSITYYGNLIKHAIRDERSHRYVIQIDPHLQELFGRDHYTHIDWQIRQELDGKALAQWLHGFYSSHAEPYPISVATLHRLCGSEAKRLSHFREELRAALKTLTEVLGRHKSQIIAQIVEGDLVQVHRAPSGARRRQTT